VSTRVIEKAEGGGYLYVEVNACHSYECRFWRMGKRHGPCTCGAEALKAEWSFEQAVGAALVTPDLETPTAAPRTEEKRGS